MASARRKLAIATWSSPREGNIYGKLKLDAGPAMAYVDYLRVKTGERITLTHVVGLAAARAIRLAPFLNGRLVLGRHIPHETIAIAFLIAVEGGNDLAKAKIENADKKSIVEVSIELRERIERLRDGKDDDFKSGQRLLAALPIWAIRPLVWTTGFLTGALGVSLKVFGLEAFPFGSCIVTNVGVLGVDEGYVPPTPWARVPAYVLVGAVRDQPAVVDGELVVKSMFNVTATLDHRFLDGYQGAKMMHEFRRLVESPWLLDGLEELPLIIPAPNA